MTSGLKILISRLSVSAVKNIIQLWYGASVFFVISPGLGFFRANIIMKLYFASKNGSKGQIFAIKTGIPVLLIFENVFARQTHVFAGKHLPHKVTWGESGDVD